jgi:uncharacterized protein involved in exopolysaccharide biosynthesis
MDSGKLSFPALLAGTLARWRMAIAVAAGTVLLALGLALILPPSYRATASFVTTDAEIGVRTGGLADLAASPGISGIASQLGISGPRDPSESPAFYAQLLSSRELLTRLLLSRFPNPRSAVPADSVTLLALLQIRSSDPDRALETAVKLLRRNMRVNVDLRTNFVVLTVDARWSPVSAEAANRAVALVSEFNKEQRVSRARARRDFLETRVAAALTELRATEDSQRLFYERNRSWENSPGLLVEERRVRRQVETANSLYLSVRQQYETARIDEVNNTPVITVVDQAVPPRRREWPRVGLMLVAASVLGAGLGLLVAAAQVLAVDWARHNPEQAALLGAAFARVTREVRAVLPGRRRTRGARDARAA